MRLSIYGKEKTSQSRYNWRNLWINVPKNLLPNFSGAKYSARGGHVAFHIVKVAVHWRQICLSIVLYCLMLN